MTQTEAVEMPCQKNHVYRMTDIRVGSKRRLDKHPWRGGNDSQEAI